MAVGSAAELIEALARADFLLIEGTAEDYWVDFKRDPYLLDSDKGKWELAKDVCAMAEGRGGLIVIGYESERRVNEGVEVATAHHPVPKELVDPTRYRDCVQERTFPRIVDIQTHWYPPGTEQSTGVFVIEVPAQEDSAKPFMVRRMIDEQGTEQIHTVGFPRRDGDRVVWLDPSQIHHEIRLGRRLALVATTSPAAATPSEDKLEAARSSATAAIEGEDTPRVCLQSVAVSEISAPEDPLFFERFGDVLTEYPPLRPMGFHYRGFQLSRHGDAVHAVGRSWCLRLEPSLFTAVLLADREGLGWALSQRMPEDAPLRINQLTLVELTLEYFRLLHEPITRGLGFPDWRIYLRALEMRTGNVVIEPYHVIWNGTPLSPPTPDAARAQEDDFASDFSSQDDPEVDAYVALAKLYALWDLRQVPFSEDNRISSEDVRRR